MSPTLAIHAVKIVSAVLIECEMIFWKRRGIVSTLCSLKAECSVILA